MSWYALYVEVGKELRTCVELSHINVKPFCPYTIERRRTKIRGQNKFKVAQVPTPLFPRYIFLTDVKDFGQVRNTRGVIDFIRDGNGPLQIPDRIMELAILSKADANGLIKEEKADESEFHAKVDDQFQFDKSSPLAGLIGRISNLDQYDTKGEIKAWISIFGANREVVVPVKHVGTILPTKASNASTTNVSPAQAIASA